MALKPRLTKTDTESLLKALESDEVVDSDQEYTEELDSVLAFLNQFNIESGPNKVKSSTLYQLYRRTRKDPKSQAAFTSSARIILNFNNGFFFVNKEQKHLLQELYAITVKTGLRRVVTTSRHRERFLKFKESRNLEAGDYFVPLNSIFCEYDKWRYDNKFKTDTMNFKYLATLCKSVFPVKQDGSKLFFGLKRSTACLIFTAEYIERTKDWSNNAGKEKKKQKKQS